MIDKLDIISLTKITAEIIEYYKNNVEIAKSDYKLLLDNQRNNPASGYTERHHILPKCLGGNDEPDNLVSLSFENHVKAHMLLYTIYPESGLSVAFELLINTKINTTCLEIDLEVITNLKIEAHKKLSEYASQRIGNKNPFFGKHHTEETKTRLSEIRKQNYIKENHPRYGVTLSAETRKKISQNHADVTGSNNPAARKVIGPDGYICGTIKEACERYKESRAIISKNKDGKYKFI